MVPNEIGQLAHRACVLLDYKETEWFGALVLSVIRRSLVQILHPIASGICFLVVPSSNARSRFVNSQLIGLLTVGIFNDVTFFENICFLCFRGMPVIRLVLV